MNIKLNKVIDSISAINELLDKGLDIKVRPTTLMSLDWLIRD